jgi:hypothetical protein
MYIRISSISSGCRDAQGHTHDIFPQHYYNDSDPDGKKPYARFMDIELDGRSVTRVYWGESSPLLLMCSKPVQHNMRDSNLQIFPASH